MAPSRRCLRPSSSTKVSLPSANRPFNETTSQQSSSCACAAAEPAPRNTESCVSFFFHSISFRSSITISRTLPQLPTRRPVPFRLPLVTITTSVYRSARHLGDIRVNEAPRRRLNESPPHHRCRLHKYSPRIKVVFILYVSSIDSPRVCNGFPAYLDLPDKIQHVGHLLSFPHPSKDAHPLWPALPLLHAVPRRHRPSTDIFAAHHVAVNVDVVPGTPTGKSKLNQCERRGREGSRRLDGGPNESDSVLGYAALYVSNRLE
ncbi:hypothetical protein R3P38DRAFT_3295128 [Favolaschia claudopus]|uniref:Uncharacterized protein n=1 Tax=Favolaschia claudopus TaxID=2862362 RepID=A0AAV9ZCI2_9AGAR